MAIPRRGFIRYLSRAWFYFRTGFSLYLSFLLGAVNTLTVVYYLLIRNVPALEKVFPKFFIFAVIAVVVGIPLGVFVGWLHMKGTPAWTSEMEISVEANPYYYKLPPGYQQEVYAPLYLEVLRLVRRIADREGLLAPEEMAEIRELEDKMKHLIKGGYIGTPRR
ncbi:MAG: hypothetical protein ACP5K1_04775, partial [Candidatus Bathyarchaeia archaeon]